jgi:hypothetical protein
MQQEDVGIGQPALADKSRRARDAAACPFQGCRTGADRSEAGMRVVEVENGERIHLRPGGEGKCRRESKGLQESSRRFHRTSLVLMKWMSNEKIPCEGAGGVRELS